MRVGPVVKEDLPALAGLYEELLGLPTDQVRMGEVYDRMGRDPAYHLLGAYTEEGELCGTAMGVVCLDLSARCRPFLVIENVVVGARFRSAGYGQALMEALERIGMEEGCAYAILVSGAARVDAHRFYHRLGYSPDRAKGFKKYLLGL